MQDPMMPVLQNSEVLKLSAEQVSLIKMVVDKASSDTNYAKRAFDSIIYILTHGKDAIPEVTSLTPASAKLGEPSFILSVKGKNFTPGSVIVWNSGVEPTTHVSDTELTTGVDMSTAQVAMQIPVQVQDERGVISNSMIFNLTPAAIPGPAKVTQTHATAKV